MAKGRNSFEKKIRDNVVAPFMQQGIQDGYGIVTDYNSVMNTATIMMAQNGTDLPGEFHFNVPCPINLGIQGVSPSPGRQCWVTFKDNDGSYPIITHFYNYFYDRVDYQAQTVAKSALPRFIHNL